MRVERPFAYCCAEGGGHIEACDCVNKNHGTAWFEVRPPPNSPPPQAKMRGMRDAAIKLALVAGKLNVALDGQERYRHHRAAVVEAMEGLSRALQATDHLSATMGGQDG